MNVLFEFLKFLSARRKFWLLPAVITLLLFGAIIVLVSGTVFAPFIYTLF